MNNPLFALVLDEEKRRSPKNDRWYWQVNLKTSQGVLKAFMWGAHQNAETDPAFPHKGDLVSIHDYVDQLAEKGSLVLNAFNRIKKEDLPEEEKAIFQVEAASAEEIEHAYQMIANKGMWENENNFHFMTKCLAQVDGEKLKLAPAASRVHHNYAGGLLVHSVEVLELCKAMYECSKKYQFISRDVLYCSAILHDIGKVQTYSINEAGMAQNDYTEKSVGHLYYSMYLVQKTFDDNPGMVTKEYLVEVLHCIAAHHGQIEWGSLKTVQSLEAGMLSRADYISSRNGMIETVLKDFKKNNQQLPVEFKLFDDNYFATDGMKKYMG